MNNGVEVTRTSMRRVEGRQVIARVNDGVDGKWTSMRRAEESRLFVVCEVEVEGVN